MNDHSDQELEFTGERFTPECVREIWYEHMHRYVFAAPLVSDAKVLDAACGEGYGSKLLSSRASQVVGVDIDGDSIAHARRRYESETLKFFQADCCKLPFEDDSFDCVVSFETVEHLSDQAGLIREFRRVLRPAGCLLISSPDKAMYSDQQGASNEFHVRELYRDEFAALLATQFPVSRLFEQRLKFHSAIWTQEPGGVTALDQQQGEQVRRIPYPAGHGMYQLALCAATESCFPVLDENLWLFDDDASSVYAHYQHEIRKNMAAGNILQQLENQVERLQSRASERAGGWWSRLFGRR